MVDSASGFHECLERHRIHPRAMVGPLASLPGPTQPGPGCPAGVQSGRRRPALTLTRPGIRRPAQVGGGCPAEPVRGDAWPGSSPLAAAATPPSDSRATHAAAAAFIVSTLLSTAVL